MWTGPTVGLNIVVDGVRGHEKYHNKEEDNIE